MSKFTSLQWMIVFSIFILSSCHSDKDKTTAQASDSSETSNKEASDSQNKTTNPFAYGIDISRYQGDEINFLDKNKDHLSFIICKATQGKLFTDSRFQSNWAKIKEKGFIRGAYHFYNGNDEAEAQAQHFLSVVGQLDDTDLPLIVDFEDSKNESTNSPEDVRSKLKKFLELIETKSNRKPIIYTYGYMADKYLTAEFSEYPLWVADYKQNQTAPKLPVAWESQGWAFWQKSNHHKIDAVNNDFDLFNGNEQQLLEFIQTH